MADKRKKSQKEKILNYMKSGHTVSPRTALNLFGCFRLSARIKDLREEGYNIETKMLNFKGTRYAGYSLRPDKKWVTW